MKKISFWHNIKLQVALAVTGIIFSLWASTLDGKC